MKLSIKIFAVVLVFLSTCSWAQIKWDPTKKPIEIVIPFAPGGASYNIAMLVNEIFTEHGWKSYVEPKPGANGIIAANYVANSKPDGYTLFQSGAGSVGTNIVFPEKSMQYNEKSWSHIGQLSQSGLGIVVRNDNTINTYGQLKKYVKENPGKFTISTWNLILGNIFTEWARREGLPPPIIVLYKGSVPAITDVLAGNVLMSIDNVGWGAPMVPYVDSKKLKVVALFDSNSSKIARQYIKENKNIVDLGIIYPDLKLNAYIGLSAPAGTPPEVIKEISRVLRAARSDPRFKSKIDKIDNFATTPNEYTEYVDENLARFRKVALTMKAQ